MPPDGNRQGPLQEAPAGDHGFFLSLTPRKPEPPNCWLCGEQCVHGMCDPCLQACLDHTQQLDLLRLPELNDEPLSWAAFFYARSGIPVHPLRPGSKIPTTRHGVKDATTDTKQVRDHWRDHPDDNIGLATGALFDVLDVDTKDGQPGRESLTRLRIGGFTVGAWAAATTPSGGRHVLFAPSGDGNHVNKSSGLDFRGRGGFIVAAPSITEVGTYRWEFADPDARSGVFDWMAAMEHLHGPPPRPEHRASTGSGDLAALAGFVGNAGDHERNSKLYWASARAHEDGLPTDELLAAAVGRGLSPSEASKTITSACTAPPRGKR